MPLEQLAQAPPVAPLEPIQCREWLSMVNVEFRKGELNSPRGVTFEVRAAKRDVFWLEVVDRRVFEDFGSVPRDKIRVNIFESDVHSTK